ncbi:MAG: type VI secretion system-associated protein TagF [Casimicrobiaceae bacterium]
MNDSFQIGWFGKLPFAGDFVHRRLPYPLLESLDAWLQLGMGQLRAAYPQNWREIYRSSPMWNCAIPASITESGLTLVGLLVPSRDRVGREFPLCAGVALPPDASPAPLVAAAHDWLMALGRTVASAIATPMTVDGFDAAVQSIHMPKVGPPIAPAGGAGDILSILEDEFSADVPTVPLLLAHALPWPELPRQFNSAGNTSYWWTNTSNGAPLRGFTSDAGLAPSLMLTLMRPQPVPRGRA